MPDAQHSKLNAQAATFSPRSDEDATRGEDNTLSPALRALYFTRTPRSPQRTTASSLLNARLETPRADKNRRPPATEDVKIDVMIESDALSELKDSGTLNILLDAVRAAGETISVILETMRSTANEHWTTLINAIDSATATIVDRLGNLEDLLEIYDQRAQERQHLGAAHREILDNRLRDLATVIDRHLESGFNVRIPEFSWDPPSVTVITPEAFWNSLNTRAANLTEQERRRYANRFHLGVTPPRFSEKLGHHYRYDISDGHGMFRSEFWLQLNPRIIGPGRGDARPAGWTRHIGRLGKAHQRWKNKEPVKFYPDGWEIDASNAF